MTRRHSCFDCTVRSSALCRVLPRQRLLAVNRQSYRKRYAPGQVIEPPEEWFGIIHSGVIRLTKSSSDGGQRIVALLFPSDFVGRPFAAGSGYAAEAATAVEICCFARPQFEALMNEEGELKQTFLE